MIIFAACHKPIIRNNVFLQILPAWRNALRAWERAHGGACVIVIFSKGRTRRVKALPYDIAQRFADDVLPEAIYLYMSNILVILLNVSYMTSQSIFVIYPQGMSLNTIIYNKP